MRPLHAAAAAGVALLAVLVYVNALHNPFVYDDYRLIVENTALQEFSSLQAILIRDITRPVVTLSYAMDAAVWGQAPFGYHLTSVLLHGVNVILVFAVGFVTTEDRRRQANQFIRASASPLIVGVVTALLFGLHPMMSQAVGYVSGRSEVLYGCFFLVAFLAGRHWMLHGGRGMWLVTVGSWLISMLAKESAVVFPLVLMAYDALVIDSTSGQRRRRYLTLSVPMLVLAATAGLWRLVVLQQFEYRGPSGDWRFALVAVDAFWRYVWLFAMPRDQTIFHALPIIGSPFEPRALADLAGVALLGFLIWRLRRVHSTVAFGLLWFALIMVPSSTLFALGIGEALAEHRAYVAGAGLLLTVGSAAGGFWSRLVDSPVRRLLAASVMVLYLAGLALQTVARNVIWSQPIELSKEAVRLAPTQATPRILVAEAYRHENRCAEAIPEYRAAIALDPRMEFSYPKLAG